VAVHYQPDDERLSRISTQWSLIYQAHWGGADAAAAAQCQFVQRYCGAVYRYLLGALRNEDAAEELFQEFALRFVRGDFRRADPERGRFRDYLKTALVHLVTDHHRRRASRPRPLPGDHPELNAAEIAEQLAAECGRPMTAGHLRVTLHRAREKFSDLLVKEVAHTLGHPTPDELLQELQDLRVLPLCEASFHRWRPAQDVSNS
jgi:DNA-directed RNA polymerase specialized sigma24 family protein